MAQNQPIDIWLDKTCIILPPLTINIPASKETGTGTNVTEHGGYQIAYYRFERHDNQENNGKDDNRGNRPEKDGQDDS